MPESHTPPREPPGVNTQPAVLRTSREKGADCAAAGLLVRPSTQSAIRMRDMSAGLLACARPRVNRGHTLLRHDDRVARLQVDRLDFALQRLAVVEGNGLG